MWGLGGLLPRVCHQLGGDWHGTGQNRNNIGLADDKINSRCTGAPWVCQFLPAIH